MTFFQTKIFLKTAKSQIDKTKQLHLIYSVVQGYCGSEDTHRFGTYDYTAAELLPLSTFFEST